MRGSASFVTVTLLALCLGPPLAHARQPPPRYPRLRPTWELSSWIGVGGGVAVGGDRPVGVFDLRAGGDATVAVGRDEDFRLGPFVEVQSASFASVHALGGVELFLGAAPRPLRMFYYSGEGVLAARVGGGWAWRQGELPGARSTPVASVTISYGYRAPFSLREPESQFGEKPGERDDARYMVGVRLWVGATVDLNDAPAWQVTGGVEFEPVGAFRYLLGIY